MKKNLLVGLLVGSLSVFVCLPPALAVEGTATIKAADLYSLAQRKSYRLGLRAGIISPTDTVNINKDSTFDFGLEFDAKLNENLDLGPRFGVISKKLQTSAASATYLAMRFGFGGRIYLMYWGEYGSTHGFFNLYGAAEADYYIASKSSEIQVNSPTSMAGIGGYGGVGLELAFGPNTGGFAEVGYQKTSVKSSDNQELPLDGYIAAVGARLAF